MKTISAKTVQAFVQKNVAKSKLFCGGGLFLNITEAGTPKWRIKYRLDGKEKTYTVGNYPHISLASARTALIEVKNLIQEGKNPVDDRRVIKAANLSSGDNSFKSVASLWFDMKKTEWSDGHYKKSVRAFERDVYPTLGNLPISQITSAIVASVIEPIHLNRDATETALRITQHLNGVFKYAQARGVATHNPADSAREVLPRKKGTGRMSAITNWNGLGDILRKAEAANLSPSVRMAHRLLAFSTARIGNIVTAEWEEFDLTSKVPIWSIPRSKLKVKSRQIDLRLPLGKEIVKELKEWQSITGNKGYVFPSPQGGTKHIGTESLQKAYRVTLKQGKVHSPHGWRSSFSTLSRDNGFEKDVVELCLDHAHEDEVVRAYDRGERFVQRTEVLDWWSNQLVRAQSGATIIPFKKKTATKQTSKTVKTKP